MLPHFSWSEKYETGIEAIDMQHRYLFVLTNNLIDEIEAGGDIALSKTLMELLEYTQKHFEFEEEILKQADYSDLAKHKSMHTSLRDRIGLYAAELKTGKLSPEGVLTFLQTWLSVHIVKEDMKYIPFVKKLGKAAN